MRILLDSHVLVWIKCAPENMTDASLAAIVDPDNDVFVSVATAWELWIKHVKKAIPGFPAVLGKGAEGFLRAANESGIELLDITLAHVAAAAALPPIHSDPFDRMLIAQAMAARLTLMTNDTAFRRYAGVHLMAA